MIYKWPSKNKDLIIEKSDKGNSVVIVDRQDYIKKMCCIMSGQKKFIIVNFTLLNFGAIQEKTR